MMEDIRHGVDPKTAYEKNIGTYGRFDGRAEVYRPARRVREEEKNNG